MAERAPDRAATPFPFFLGCGRSGTTLVRVMFDAHPQLAIPPGTGLAKHMGERHAQYEVGGGIDVDRFERDVLASDRFSIWGLDEATVHRALHDPAPATVADAVRRVYAAYAASHGKPRYANKSHGYVLSIPVVAALLPEARFVHIVRDGRNVALSLIDSPFGPNNVAAGARFWRRRVERGRFDGHRLGPGRYREVAYEAVVADPEAVLTDLCAFLELPFDPAMLRYYEQPEHVSRGLKHPDIHKNLIRPPTPNVRDWRDQMSGQDVARFEAIAGSSLERFGYERAVPVPLARKLEERFRTSVRSARHRASRVRRADPALKGSRHA